MIDLGKLARDEIAKHEKLMAEMVATRYTGGIVTVADVVKAASAISGEDPVIITEKVRNFLNGLMHVN